MLGKTNFLSGMPQVDHFLGPWYVMHRYVSSVGNELPCSLSLRVMLMRFSFLAIKTRVLVGIYMVGFGHFNTVSADSWPCLEQFEIIAASWPLLEVFATPRCDFCLGERDMCFSMLFLVVILKHGFNLVSIFFDVIHLPYTDMIRIDPARSFSCELNHS